MGYDLRRLQAPLLVLVATGLALAGLGLPVRAVLSGRPAWMPQADSTSETAGLEYAAQRISGLRYKGLHEKKLSFIIGSSSAVHSIDPDQLGKEMGGSSWPEHWYILHGGGMNAGDSAQVARLILQDRLQPRQVVFAINPVSLANLRNFLIDPDQLDPTPLLESLHQDDYHEVRRNLDQLLLGPLNRNFPNRTRLNLAVRQAILVGKVRALTSLGFNCQDLFEPWTRSIPTGWYVRDHVSEAEFNSGMQKMRAKGLFDAANYTEIRANLEALLQVVRELTDRGIEVIIVLLPETTILRQTVPEQAMQSLLDGLREEFGAGGPSLLDCRDWMPDDRFSDAIHNDPQGRVIFTSLLAEKLRSLHQ